MHKIPEGVFYVADNKGGLAIKQITTYARLWQAGVISQDHRVFYYSHNIFQ